MKMYTQKHSVFPAPDRERVGVIRNCDPGQDHYYVGDIG